MDAISSGITTYHLDIFDIEDVPDRDSLLRALNILSLMCAKSWGYTDEAFDYNLSMCKHDVGEVSRLFKGD